MSHRPFAVKDVKENSLNSLLYNVMNGCGFMPQINNTDLYALAAKGKTPSMLFIIQPAYNETPLAVTLN